MSYVSIPAPLLWKGPVTCGAHITLTHNTSKCQALLTIAALEWVPFIKRGTLDVIIPRVPSSPNRQLRNLAHQPKSEDPDDLLDT